MASPGTAVPEGGRDIRWDDEGKAKSVGHRRARQPFARLYTAIRGRRGRSLVAACWQDGLWDVDLEVSPVQLSRVLALLVLDYLCAGLRDVRATRHVVSLRLTEA